MTIPLTLEDRSISITQFEKQHQPSLVRWLTEQKNYRHKEAEELSFLIINYLKTKCPPRKPYQLAIIWQIIHKFTQQELSQVINSMGKNFGLTEANFEEMQLELQRGNDALFEKVFLNHFEDCTNYLRRNYHASQEDAYDASMEAMLEFMKRMWAGKVVYGNLRFLFTKMAAQIYLKWIKKENKKREIQSFDLGPPPDVYDAHTIKTLHKAWEGLCGDCQGLLRQFYYDGVALNTMAEELEKPAATLRKQKQRCVDKLRKLFAKLD